MLEISGYGQFVGVITETGLTLAALRVLGAQAEEAGLALVAARPLYIGLAAALASHHAEGRFCVAVAHASILGTIWVTVTGYGTDRQVLTCETVTFNQCMSTLAVCLVVNGDNKLFVQCVLTGDL